MRSKFYIWRTKTPPKLFYKNEKNEQINHNPYVMVMQPKNLYLYFVTQQKNDQKDNSITPTPIINVYN